MESSPAQSALMPALRADLPELLDDVAATLAQLDPSYADFLAGGRDEVLPAAEYAMSLLVSEAAEVLGEPLVGLDGRAEAADGADVAFALFEALGREQWRRDQPVRPLLSAYQLGGRVTWRRIAGVAVRLALPAEALVALAEAVFRLVDEISAATISGYVDEQAQSATERERLRDVLAERLLSDRADSAVVARAAHAAGWTLAEMEEGVVDEAWLAKKPQWAKYRFHPVSFAMVWKRAGRAG